MGRLKPGATYIYEKANGITYAREAGAHPGDRFEIGRDYNIKEQDERTERIKMWDRIYEMSKSNPALQDAIERVIIIYELQKGEEPPGWHPV